MIARKKSTIGLNIKKYLESSQNKKASLEWNDLKHIMQRHRTAKDDFCIEISTKFKTDNFLARSEGEITAN